MCMACNTGKITKKKIALFSSIAVAIGATTYFTFTTTNNPALAATIPLFLSFAACPAMCVGMGGIMWLMYRKKKNAEKMQGNSKIEGMRRQAKGNGESSENFCCNVHAKNRKKEADYTIRQEHEDMEEQQLKENNNRERDGIRPNTTTNKMIATKRIDNDV